MNVASPDGSALSATVTPVLNPFSIETVTVNAAIPPGWTLAAAGWTLTHRSASVSPCIRTHWAPAGAPAGLAAAGTADTTAAAAAAVTVTAVANVAITRM